MSNFGYESGLDAEWDDDWEWDPVMGDAEDHVETDDNWLDEFWGEEDFA